MENNSNNFLDFPKYIVYLQQHLGVCENPDML